MSRDLKFLYLDSYQEVFTDEEFIYKRLLDYRVKKYFNLNIKFPMGFYTKFKFGIDNFNNEEIRNFHLLEKLPHDMQKYFSKVYDLTKISEINYLKCELVKNYDNTNALSLSNFKPNSSFFWDSLEECINNLVESNIFLFDFKPENILVKKVTESKEIPVFSDFKRMGTRTYLSQLNLLFDSEKKRKISRRFNRLVKQYN